MSVRKLGQEVMVRPTALGTIRRKSGFATPPGSTSPSKSLTWAWVHGEVDVERVGLVEMVEPLHLPLLRGECRRYLSPLATGANPARQRARDQYPSRCVATGFLDG
jgi:hypothetical protein